MALPQAIKGRVTSLGRYDTSSPFAVARARMAGAEGVKRAVDSTVAQVQNVFAEAKVQKDKQSVFDAEVGLANDTNIFKSEFEGKQVYNPEDLPNNMVEGQERIAPAGVGEVAPVERATYPKSEVWPQLYREQVDAYIQSRASSITDDKLRDKWVATQTMRLTEDYSRYQVAAVGQQHNEMMAKQSADIDQAEAEGRYEDAVGYVAMSNLSEEAKVGLTFKIRKTEEFQGYYEVMNGQDAQTMQDAADALRSDAYAGRLLDRERKVIAGQLDTAIAQQLTGTVSAEKARKADVNLMASNYQKTYVENNLSPEGLKEAYEHYMVNRESYSPENGAKARQMMADYNDMITTISAPPVLRQSYVESAKTDVEYNKRNAWARKQDSKDSDTPYQSVFQMTGSQTPIVNPKADDFAMTFSEQIGIWRNAKQIPSFEQYVIGKPLAKQQVSALQNAIDTSSDKDLMKIFGGMQQATSPEEFNTILTQLGQNSGDGAYQAGRLANEGDIETAQAILKGRQMLQGKVFTEKENATIAMNQQTLRRQMGSLWYGDEAKQNSIVNAVSSYMASKVTDLDTFGGPWGKTDLDRAMDLVVRPVTYNGEMLELPPQMDGKQFDRAMDLMTPEALTMFGPVMHMTHEELAEGLRDEDFKLKSIGTGAYLVLSAEGNQALMSTPMSNFIIHLDQTKLSSLEAMTAYTEY